MGCILKDQGLYIFCSRGCHPEDKGTLGTYLGDKRDLGLLCVGKELHGCEIDELVGDPPWGRRKGGAKKIGAVSGR